MRLEERGNPNLCDVILQGKRKIAAGFVDEGDDAYERRNNLQVSLVQKPCSTRDRLEEEKKNHQAVCAGLHEWASQAWRLS